MRKGYPLCPQWDLGMNVCFGVNSSGLSGLPRHAGAVMTALNHAPPAANPPTTSLTKCALRYALLNPMRATSTIAPPTEITRFPKLHARDGVGSSVR